MGDIEALIIRLAKDNAALQPAPHPVLLSLKWMGVALAYLMLMLLFSGIRPDFSQRLHESWLFAEMLALVVIFITTSFCAALLSFPDLHQMRSMVFAPVVAFTLFMLVLLVAWQADQPPALTPLHSIECTLSITLSALLPAAWTLYQMRKFATTHYGWAGTVALLYAFSVGAIWLRLYEVNDSIMHVLLWHYLPMSIFALVGWWLGKKIFKW